jgi:hypothetical protein
VLVLVVLALSLAPVPVAGAEQVSARQFDQLVDQASTGDGQALERLRGVDNVDGQAVNMRRALDAQGRQLRDRLRALDQGGSRPTSGDPSAQAKDILAGDDYHQPDPPRPFRKPLERLGDWINSAINGITFGNSPFGWFVLAAMVAGVVGLIAALLSRRRVKGPGSRRRDAAAVSAEDPVELERQAERAEQAGDHSLAVRLRYRAGLLRLRDREAIDYRPSLTAHQVSAQLRSERYDELATRFEGVAYGEQEASAEDAADAAREWREVVKEAKK